MLGRTALFLALLLPACSSSSGESAPNETGPSYAGLELSVDSAVVFFTNTEGAFDLTCVEGSRLDKASGEPWYDERPALCAGEPYYLDDTYVPNLCLGCDVVSCGPFPRSKTFGVRDFLRMGSRPPPDGVTGAPAEVPVVESAADSGPYSLTIRYFSDASCTEPSTEKPPLLIDPSSDGGGDPGGGGY